MIISKIIQNGLELSVETNDIPFQYSANLKVQFVKDTNYKDWTLQVYASPPRDTFENEEILLLSVDDEGYFNLPPIFFKKRGKIRLSFSLCGTDDEIIHFGILNIVVKKSLGDTDSTLPDDENVWMEYVRAETDRYFAENYEGKLQEFYKQSETMTELYDTTIQFVKEKKEELDNNITNQNKKVTQDINNFETKTNKVIDTAKEDLKELSEDLMDAKLDKSEGEDLKARLTNLEANGVIASDTMPIGSIVEIGDTDEIPEDWEVVDTPIYSNPNLLINGKFQVWQRGASIKSDKDNMIYTADRWIQSKAGDNNTTYSRASSSRGLGGIEINGSSFPVVLAQVIEFGLSYGTYTLTCAFNVDGVSIIKSFTFNYKSTSDIFTLDVSEVKGNIKFGANPADSNNDMVQITIGKSCRISWVKLEKSPLYTPLQVSNYNEEIYKCRRYYYSGYKQGNRLQTESTDNKKFKVQVAYEVMRVAPTILQSDIYGYPSDLTAAIKSNPLEDSDGRIIETKNNEARFESIFTKAIQTGVGFRCIIRLDAEIYNCSILS